MNRSTITSATTTEPRARGRGAVRVATARARRGGTPLAPALVLLILGTALLALALGQPEGATRSLLLSSAVLSLGLVARGSLGSSTPQARNGDPR